MVSRTRVMGILNVTPDSFSDGGQWFSVDSAVQHGCELHENGADVIDVGGESTRPGAQRISAAEEQDRVLPVVAELAQEGLVVSIDTMNASTARAAIRAGASVVNDVSGGLADEEMFGVIADCGVPCVISHWRSASAVMMQHARYLDVVQEVRTELQARITAALACGIAAEKIILDPGLGFAKDSVHNWSVLANLDSLFSLGFPVMLGASRKRFIGELLAKDAPILSRDFSSTIVATLAAQAGVWAVRVHDARSARAALDVVDAWNKGKNDE